MANNYMVIIHVVLVLFLLSSPLRASDNNNNNNNNGDDEHSSISSSMLESYQLEWDKNIDPTKLSFKLSFTWPKGYCKTKGSGCEKAASLPDHFTIHGLWPIYRAKCDDSTEAFSLDHVKDLQDKLDQNWPDLKNYGNPSKYASFWDHEWVAHGKKCNLYSVHDYFKQSLALYDASNVLQLLQKAGNPTTVEGVKKAYPGRRPTVFCKNGSDGGYYFYQLEFCLDSNEAYEDCPEPAKPDKTHCSPGKQFSYGA
ncbi:hypothetical protein DM860_011031 [Cuscuta australis]|uniref:Uncharacterized protein n=1 Tax=Cuscuta australis TaxID=267555 RepID=A0A328E4L2_9ASTE|nr:hypothetical protein DM860_011031 [Cuscuta australis]